MAVSGVNTTASASGSTSSSSLLNNTPQEVQDRFMTLLIEQLKNQDPLNPMDNAQMTSQMSQISMVSGIQELNQSMSSLTQSMLSNQTSQAISLIGKSVAVPSTNLSLPAEGNREVKGGFWLDTAADHATVTIQDQTGNTIRTLNFNDLKAGLQDFSWDGQSDSGVDQPAGIYTVSVGAVQGDKNIDAQALQWGTVNSVEQDTSGSWNVILEGGTTPVSMSNVRSVVADSR